MPVTWVKLCEECQEAHIVTESERMKVWLRELDLKEEQGQYSVDIRDWEEVVEGFRSWRRLKGLLEE